MGCSWSGLDALYGAVGSGVEVWVNKRRFKIQRQLGEGGSAFVYLVREQLPPGEEPLKISKVPNPGSEDGLYALKKVLIQSVEQLALVKQEIQVSSLFNHPNVIRLLEHSIISVKGGEAWSQEAYMLFPVYRDGTVLEHLTRMQTANTYFPTITVLHIFQQICAGLKHMHTHDPPYAHNDMKPGNVLLTLPRNQPPVAVIMDFGSATPAQRELRNHKEAMAIQDWAAQHCTAPYRAPELWDPPSETMLDERTDIWALGCTLYALMYGLSPFEYALAENPHLAAISGVVKFPPGPNPPYPETLHQFVKWMLTPSVASRPYIEDVCIHVDKLIAKFDTDARGLWTSKE